MSGKEGFKDAERPTTDEGRKYHIWCRPGDVAPYCFLVGAPERAELTAKLFDKAEEKAFHRGLRLCTGEVSGIPMSVATTGMGCPTQAIVVRELHELGVHTFIRVGSCGAIQEGMKLGDSIISTGAVRLDGASQNWIHLGYPAVASWEIVQALVEAAGEARVRHHVGITASTDDFYEGQGRPGPDGFLPERQRHLFEELKHAGVLNFEMESSALFTYAGIYGLRAGTICAVFAERATGAFGMEGEEQAARIAIAAMKKLYSRVGKAGGK